MNLLSVKLNELNELTLNNLFKDIACNISNELSQQDNNKNALILSF